MSSANVTWLQSVISSGCYFLGNLWQWLITIQETGGVVPSGWSNLVSLVRSPDDTERQFATLMLSQLDMIVEVPKQGGFDGSAIKPNWHQLVFEGNTYEIWHVWTDETDGVWDLYCRKLQPIAGVKGNV
jgi:hypothetical protein